MFSLDERIFLALNFNGGPTVDGIMSVLSGIVIWIPFYLLILWMVYRKYGLKKVVAFLCCVALAAGLADIFCGIFKHSGLLKDLWESFPARLRPMFTPEIRDLAHVPSFKHGLYGTVSAHAATITAIVFLSAITICKKWFTLLGLLVLCTICYSRIYLACHFPKDLLLGFITGLVAGGCLYMVQKWLFRTIDKCENQDNL